MKNLTKFYNSNILDDSANLYLYYSLGDSKYAVGIGQIMEIMKLPLLDYPQKLANNVIGLLNYNNFTINVLDLRFYLGINVTPYSVSNQLMIVRTDETIFGLIVDKVEDIIPLDQSKIEYFSHTGEEKIIEFLYKKDEETISAVNLEAIEKIIKQGVASKDIDIPSLFPHDDDSRYKLIQRNQALLERSEMNLVANVFSQDKFISFLLGESAYCINLENVKEFLKNYSITPIPCGFDYIAGIITLRGDFVSVIDIKKFLELGNAKIDYKSSKNRIIVLEAPEFTIGFLVDEIFNIMEIPEEVINESSHKNCEKYVSAEVILNDKFYTILNVKEILSDERFFINQN